MAERSCGGCTMCCKVLGIVELDKPAARWCPHCDIGRACRIYEDRPGECRTFHCIWLLRESFGPEWRPDRSKFVMYGSTDKAAFVINVDPTAPDAWRRKPFYENFKQWAVGAVRDHTQLIVMVGDRATVILPDRDVPLGPVAPGDRIVSRRVTVDGKERIEPRVDRAAE
ncbi:hypothetical protein [Hansschlegelia zhihuaiae]|uniref:YkgJ family cysteine cluster protein n=1 Tax=Hansschlegelia zhihuaiae TaxID=405005 RepID=A0A4Q0MQX2_9HYPH|nr:hypothetical protein [Hansschlegelia zhihuaiae]RXF75536.1 hypothetical protein EK403_01390 [Hansschlegelia zhihuaiae]